MAHDVGITWRGPVGPCCVFFEYRVPFFFRVQSGVKRKEAFDEFDEWQQPVTAAATALRLFEGSSTIDSAPHSRRSGLKPALEQGRTREGKAETGENGGLEGSFQGGEGAGTGVTQCPSERYTMSEQNGASRATSRATPSCGG